MRSVSIASDGSALVGGNHKVRLERSCVFWPPSLTSSHLQGVVYVWTIQPGLAFTDLQPKTRFQAHSRYLIRVLISPDTKCVRSPSRPSEFSADTFVRRQLATCSADTTIKIWTPILSPQAAALAAQADPNNLYARGGIADGTGYQLEKVLQGHQRWVWDMAYSADSAYLVSGASRFRCANDGPHASRRRVLSKRQSRDTLTLKLLAQRVPTTPLGYGNSRAGQRSDRCGDAFFFLPSSFSGVD